MYLQETFVSTKLFHYRMKFFLLTASAAMSFAIFKQALFPNFHLTLILVLTVVVDFVSGILKSVALDQPVISRKLRRTVFKANMYGILIVLTYICRAMLQGHNMVYDFIGLMINNSVVTTLIYIETLSILENIIGMDKEGSVAKFVRPIHLLLSWKMKSALLELLGKEDSKYKKSTCDDNINEHI